MLSHSQQGQSRGSAADGPGQVVAPFRLVSGMYVGQRAGQSGRPEGQGAAFLLFVLTPFKENQRPNF